MIFFLDENFPKPAVHVLADRGHAYVDIRGTGREGEKDDALFRLAQAHNAVFLTTDKDFFHTVPLTFASHHGTMAASSSLWPSRTAGTSLRNLPSCWTMSSATASATAVFC